MNKEKIYLARVILISKVKEIPEKFVSFVRFGAFYEKRELHDTEKVAIVQVMGTESYFPIFLEKNTMENVKRILNQYQAELEPVSLLTIRNNLRE